MLQILLSAAVVIGASWLRKTAEDAETINRFETILTLVIYSTYVAIKIKCSNKTIGHL